MPTGAYTPSSTAGAGIERLSPPGTSHGPTEENQSKPSSVRSSTSSRGPKHKPTSLAPSAHSAQKPCPSPMYEEVANSPPMTSFLNDRYAASTAQESVYLEHIRKLRMAKYVLSALIIGAAAGALGTSGHALWSYNHTKLSSSWSLFLWPVDLDLKPTIGILVPAAIAIVSSVAYLSVAVIPSPHSRTTLLNTLYLLVTLMTFTLALFATTFYTALVYSIDPHRSTTTRPYARQTIQSFTCAFYRGPGRFLANAQSLQLPVFGLVGYPAGFGRVCQESEASWACMAAVMGLSLVGVGFWAVGRWWESEIEEGRKVRYDEKWGETKGERAGSSGKGTPSP